jgi:hypothetical protein
MDPCPASSNPVITGHYGAKLAFGLPELDGDWQLVTGERNNVYIYKTGESR